MDVSGLNFVLLVAPNFDLRMMLAPAKLDYFVKIADLLVFSKFAEMIILVSLDFDFLVRFVAFEKHEQAYYFEHQLDFDIHLKTTADYYSENI